MNTGLATRRRFVLVLGCLTGLAAVSIDMSLPAIPAMVFDLATSMSTGQQIVGLFMAGLALGQLPAGVLSDRLGRMPVIYAGVGIFTVAGIACAFSTSIELMLAARFVQGMGASVGVVVTRAIVRDIASGVEAARLLTVMVMIFTAAPMLAPMIGAFLVTTLGWRMPFIAIALFGAALLFGVSTILRETHVPIRTEHHILRQLLYSTREFFSHRRSVLGVLLVLLPAAGFMSLITASPALVIEIYDFPVKLFGIIFATAGFSILVGSALNRRLLVRVHDHADDRLRVRTDRHCRRTDARNRLARGCVLLVAVVERLSLHVRRRFRPCKRHRARTRPGAEDRRRRRLAHRHDTEPRGIRRLDRQRHALRRHGA